MLFFMAVFVPLADVIVFTVTVVAIAVGLYDGHAVGKPRYYFLLDKVICND